MPGRALSCPRRACASRTQHPPPYIWRISGWPSPRPCGAGEQGKGYCTWVGETWIRLPRWVRWFSPSCSSSAVSTGSTRPPNATSQRLDANRASTLQDATSLDARRHINANRYILGDGATRKWGHAGRPVVANVNIGGYSGKHGLVSPNAAPTGACPMRQSGSGGSHGGGKRADRQPMRQ